MQSLLALVFGLAGRVPRLRPILWLALTAAFSSALHAASSPTIDNLISKLPDPAQWTKSPLETALKDPDPMFQDPAFRQLVLSLRGRDPKGALDSLRALARKYPNKPQVQFLHGLFALRLQLYSEAEASFRTLLSAKATAALGWYGVACVQTAQNRSAEALASLHRAVTLQPSLIGAWILLAVSEARQGHPLQGADAARQVTRLLPGLAVGWGILGYCDTAAKKFPDAITCYAKAVQADHHYAFGYEGMGICLVQMNQPAQAVEPLKTALALAPQDYLAATELGYCYLCAGKPADGLKVCQRAVKIKPGFSKGWDLLGLCFAREGKTRQATAAFQRAVQSDAGNTYARAHLAAAAQKTGR